jgi:hypothetical protein
MAAVLINKKGARMKFANIIGSFILTVSLWTSSCEADFSKTYTHNLSVTHPSEDILIEQPLEQKPVTECIVSWNALRPDQGELIFFAKVMVEKQWSDWIKIAEWGKGVQKSFCDEHDPLVTLSIDALTNKNGKPFESVAVKVTAEGGANLAAVRSVFICASNMRAFTPFVLDASLPTVILKNVPCISQMLLNHPRCHDMCSPTSTTMAVNYLDKTTINPLILADQAHDQQFDIYGNWVLNVAAAYDLSKGTVSCRVQRLNSLQELHASLAAGCPVVVSVKGPLKGGALPYNNGHLMVIVGWDAEQRAFVCHDPAFPTVEATCVRYAFEDFVEAIGRRRQISYVFCPSK